MGWYDDYPDNWDQIRKAVYKRDGYTCQKCGAKGGPYGDTELHCHHIVPKSKGGSDHPQNLATICWRCHNAEHDHHIPKMSEMGRRSSSGTSHSPNQSGTPGFDREQMDEDVQQLHDIYTSVSGDEKSTHKNDSSSTVSHQQTESKTRKGILKHVVKNFLIGVVVATLLQIVALILFYPESQFNYLVVALSFGYIGAGTAVLKYYKLSDLAPPY